MQPFPLGFEGFWLLLPRLWGFADVKLQPRCAALHFFQCRRPLCRRFVGRASCCSAVAAAAGGSGHFAEDLAGVFECMESQGWLHWAGQQPARCDVTSGGKPHLYLIPKGSACPFGETCQDQAPERSHFPGTSEQSRVKGQECTK